MQGAPLLRALPPLEGTRGPERGCCPRVPPPAVLTHPSQDLNRGLAKGARPPELTFFFFFPPLKSELSRSVLQKLSIVRCFQNASRL